MIGLSKFRSHNESTDRKQFKRRATISGIEIRNERMQDIPVQSIDLKRRRKSVLFSNFSDVIENDVTESNDSNFRREDSGVYGEDGSVEHLAATNTATRRNILGGPNLSETSGTNSMSSGSCSSFSGSIKRSRSSFDREPKKLKLSSDDDGMRSSVSDTEGLFQFSHIDCNDTNVDDTSKFISETTVDWLTHIEKDEANTSLSFRDAFTKLTATPNGSSKSSPTIVKAGKDSISVSPCLSASSVQFLQKAPILSPVDSKRTLRRRRTLAPEYD